MSAWTHSICESCWNKKNPDRPAVHIVGVETDDDGDVADPEVCCYCGKTHSSGIYVRGAPEETPCLGVGKVHDET